MKNLIKFSSLAIATLLISCGGGDDNPSTGGTPSPSTPVAGKFQKNVLIEDFTGTWCQYCPRVAYGIQQVEAANIKAYPVAIHRGGGSAYDPFNFNAAALENYINLTGYPTAMLNRKTTWNNETNTTEVRNQYSPNCDLGLALNSTVTGGNINLDVKVKFDANYTGLKLVVYVLEDNLHYNQVNSTSYFGGANPIVNMEHDHVLRQCLTDLVNGNAITGTNDGATVTTNFSIPVPTNITDANNMSFVAFVIDANGKAINVRGALPNVNQTFEENQ
jgi:hypothetical protein